MCHSILMQDKISDIPNYVWYDYLPVPNFQKLSMIFYYKNLTPGFYIIEAIVWIIV